MTDCVIEVTINGEKISSQVRADESLIKFLRDRLHVLDAKVGCDKGDCGTCTVLMDGKPVKSCTVLAAQADGRVIKTIKGIQDEPLVRKLQESFVKYGAVQCGFCTHGMLIAAKSLLEKNSGPSRNEIKQAISGNLCRCTGYTQIVDAIEACCDHQQESAHFYGGEKHCTK